MLDNVVRGGQIFLHQVLMFKQVMAKAFSTALFLGVVLTYIVFAPAFKALDSYSAINYMKAQAARAMHNTIPFLANHGVKKEPKIDLVDARRGVYAKGVAASAVIASSKHQNAMWEFFGLCFRCLLFLGASTFGLMASIFAIWTSFGKSASKSSVVSGGKLHSADEVNDYLRSKKKAGSFKIGGMHLLQGSETSHILITGTTGAGKTTCMHELLPQIKEKGQAAIIVDYTGAMCERYYDERRGDVIIGEDERSHSWDFWGEIEDEHNMAIITNSLFADKNSYDEMWNNASRQFFKDAALAVSRGLSPSMKKFYSILATDPLKQVRSALEGFPAASLMDPGNERTAMSIRTNTIAFIDWIEKFKETEKKITISSWIRNLSDVSNEKHKTTSPKQLPWLFLKSSPKQRIKNRNFHSTLLDLAMNHVMELGESRDRRIWLIIDELPSLKKLPSIPTALSEFRKYGGCIVASIQSPHQLFEIYGKNNAYAMMDQMGTKFIFRTEEHNFASYLCNNFGEVEYISQQKNISYGAHEMRDGTSYTEQERKKLLVTPADLAALANLEAYVKLPISDMKVAKIKVKF